MKVLVTGASGCLAQALLPKLCGRPDVERVTGADLLPARFQHSKFSASAIDIRNPSMANLLRGHDALVHLAFVVLRGRMGEPEMFDINVAGSRALFLAARAAGVKRLIHLSSAAVYGSGVDLDERVPLRPLPGFLYAQHKARLEETLASEFPECAVLRPHVILGPHAQPLLKWLLAQPFHVQQTEPYPLLQCVHEDDVAQAVLLALTRDVSGAFNLATGDRFSFRDAIRGRHRLPVPLPLSIARAGLYVAWKVSGWGGEPGWIEGLAKTLLLDCRRARAQLGWRPSHSAAQTLAQT